MSSALTPIGVDSVVSAPITIVTRLQYILAGTLASPYAISGHQFSGPGKAISALYFQLSLISKGTSGGLIIVGSYVPKTTKQVDELKLQCGHNLRTIEVCVDKLAMKSEEEREEEISGAAELAEVYLRTGKDTLVMSSRKLITRNTPAESLDINFKVSSGLVEIVRRIKTSPRYILAKGGITSSDIATKALEAKHAKIVGQALAGVPLWQLGPGNYLST
ncbi:hypothetical protein LXL04_024296 [Taraxacum kok-saghyz]